MTRSCYGTAGKGLISCDVGWRLPGYTLPALTHEERADTCSLTAPSTAGLGQASRAVGFWSPSSGMSEATLILYLPLGEWWGEGSTVPSGLGWLRVPKETRDGGQNKLTQS